MESGTSTPPGRTGLLVAAGDNPERLHSEAAWAHLCGVSPARGASLGQGDPPPASTVVGTARPTGPSGTS